MSTVNWSIEATKAFALFVTLNWPFGLWPLLEVNFFLILRMAIALIQMALMTAATLYEMSQNCGLPQDLPDNLLIVAVGMINISKIIFYHVHRNKMRVNVESAIEDWASTELYVHRGTMEKYHRISKRITYALTGMMICSCGLYFIKALIMEPAIITFIENSDGNSTRLIYKKPYLFPSCTLKNIREPYRRIIFLNQFIQWATCGTITVGSDAFFLAITAHLCGQFEILKLKFTSLGSDYENPLENIVNRKDINNLITRHQHLLRLADLLESAYNKIILTQLMICILLITVSGFSLLVTLQSSDLVGTIKSVAIMQFMLMQSFMYACIGEAMQNQGDDITQSVYHGTWYELPLNFTKDLLFIMMRSNASFHLTAGKFIHMTRATFMDVLKTSFSYLSVLRIMLLD